MILSWSDGKTIDLWETAVDHETSVADQLRDHETRTATTLDATGRLRTLTFDELLARQAKIAPNGGAGR